MYDVQLDRRNNAQLPNEDWIEIVGVQLVSGKDEPDILAVVFVIELTGPVDLVLERIHQCGMLDVIRRHYALYVE